MTQNPLNPYAAPRSAEQPATDAPGKLDVGIALSDGWEAMKRNFVPYLVFYLLFAVVGVAATVTVVGIFLVLPVLMWGYYRFCLHTLDGEAKPGELFSGFSKYGDALGKMLIVALLTIAASLPGVLVSMVVPMALEPGSGNAAAVVGVTFLFRIAWDALVSWRFWFAGFFAVDQGLSGVDAMRASWGATRPQKLTLVVFVLAAGLVMIAGMLALVVGVIPATMVMTSAYAAGYRQVSRTGKYGTSTAMRSA